MIRLETYASEEQWHRGTDKLPGRSRSIGGSLAPHLVGAHPTGSNLSALSIWAHLNPNVWERLGERPELPGPSGINTEVRRALEPAVAAIVQEHVGALEIWQRPYSILRNDETPWAHASPDGIIWRLGLRPVMVSGKSEWSVVFDAKKQIARMKAAIEYKTVHPYAKWKWQPDDPDLAALIQCQHTLMVAGLPTIYLGALVGYGDDDADRLCYEVTMDRELVELIRAAEERLWDYIQRDEEPPADGFDDYTRALRVLHPMRTKEEPRTIVLGADWTARQLEYDRLGREIDKLERERNRLAQEIEAEMAHHDATEAAVPASEELPDGALWRRYKAEVSPQRCKGCGQVVRRAYTRQVCQPQRRG